VVSTSVNFLIAVFWFSGLFGRRKRAISIMYAEDRGKIFSQIYLCTYIYICTFSECVSVDLGIHHAMCLLRIVLSPVTNPAVQYFCALSNIRHDFNEES
jgi:hypothetical protein